MYSNSLYNIKAQNKYMAYQSRGKRSEKISNLLEIVSFMYQKAHKMLSVNGQRYVKTLYDIWSVSMSPNHILLQPFDSVYFSCELICDIE